MNYTYESMRDILTAPQVSENFNQMLKLGRTAYHEAAFAVYDSDEQDGFEVSKLLVPEFKTHDFFDQLKNRVHSSVEVDELVYRYDHEANPFSIAMKAHIAGDYSGFSDKAQRAVANIQQDPDLDKNSRIDLTVATLMKDLAKLEIVDKVVRDDIKLLVHSHPQVPAIDYPSMTLVGPSEADVEAYSVLGYNYVDGIVAGGRSGQTLLLYTARNGANISPGAYNHDFASSKPTISSALAKAGFVAAFLDLNSDGTLKDGQSNELREFVDAI